MTTTPYKRLPARPDTRHLKKQAKDLLALYRSNDAAALQRFRTALPAAAGKSDTTLAAQGLRLHDAQSCIAREYGFASWADLQGFVTARRAVMDDPARASAARPGPCCTGSAWCTRATSRVA